MTTLRKISNPVSSPSGMRRPSFNLPQYPRRFSAAGVRLPVSARRLWDPTLLARLQVPLTRFRD
jgi:hypothetical protein